MAFRVPNHCRVRTGRFASTDADGNNGMFVVNLSKQKEPPPPIEVPAMFTVIASDGGGWEHVSVSLNTRTPTWEEMCRIKDLFWGDEDRVVQFHPPRSEYVNNHPHCLHLWRPTGVTMPFPPPSYVGTIEKTR